MKIPFPAFDNYRPIFPKYFLREFMTKYVVHFGEDLAWIAKLSYDFGVVVSSGEAIS